MPRDTLVVYEEVREGRSGERRIAGGDQAYAGIDVNSTVNIDVDEAAMNAAAGAGEDAPLRAAQLNDRLEQLQGALRGLEAAKAANEAALAAWSSAVRGGEYDEARTAIGTFAQTASAVLNPLQDAVVTRLTAEGKANDVGLAIEAFSMPGAGGYDWEAIGAALGREIELAGAELDRLLDEAVSLEIRAYRVGRDGSVAPIALYKYNDVVEGAAVPVPKMTTTVDPQAMEAFRRYQEVANRTEQVQGIGAALRAAFEVEIGSKKAALDRSLQAARTLIGGIGTVLDDAAAAFPTLGDTLQRVLAEAEPELTALADSVSGAWTGAAADVQMIRSYAELAPRFGAMEPDEAMATLLAVGQQIPTGGLAANGALVDPRIWNARLALVGRLATAIQQLEAADLARVSSALGTRLGLVTSFTSNVQGPLDTFISEARPLAELATRLLTSRPVLAASAQFPTPPGQRAVSLATNADTYIDLEKIAAGRAAGDEIVVEYRTLTGDRPLPLTWRDRFELESYGWHSRTVASLGFMAREGSSSFSPAPTLSYMVQYRGWPDVEGDAGLHRSFWSRFSAGLSTMSVDFSDEDDVELGLAGTLGLFDNLVLGGVGLNLQHDEDRLFYFFSIRLFSASGGLGSSN